MSSSRTPALGFILITLTLDILGIGLLALLVAIKARCVHEATA